MGTQCCESKGNLNVTSPQQYNRYNTNVHRGGNAQNYSNKNTMTKPLSNIPAQNYGKNKLVEEQRLPSEENINRASLGSSVINNNSGERMSQKTPDIYQRNDNNNLLNINKNNNNNLNYNLTNPKIIKDFMAHDKIIVCMIELHNKLIATGSYDNTIKIWDISSNNNSSEKTIKEEGKIFSLLEFEDNMLLASIDKTPEGIQEISQIQRDYIIIRLWDLSDPNNQSIFDFKGHSLRVNALVKCDDKHFASCSNDNKIFIWDYILRKSSNVLKGHEDCILHMINLNDGRLCSGSADTTIKIWDWENGQCVATLTGHNHWVKCLCQLSNGYIISGSQDNIIKVWENDQYLFDLEGHERSVRSICQIGNSNYIATASFDHTIKLWDLNSRSCVNTLREHKSSVINVIYHSDGYLVSCSNDQTVKVWNIK